jgi:hypothetical protein
MANMPHNIGLESPKRTHKRPHFYKVYLEANAASKLTETNPFSVPSVSQLEGIFAGVDDNVDFWATLEYLDTHYSTVYLTYIVDAWRCTVMHTPGFSKRPAWF